MKKTYSGYTDKTPEHLQLDSGAWFINYDMETDTYETAVAANKLLGATRGGGTFDAVPTLRQILVDGVKGKGKGLESLESWDVNMQATVVEITKETLMRSLTTGFEDVSDNESYDIIRARNHIELSDYVDNITWVGTLSGSDKPIIIQVFNALNSKGLSLQTQDSNEGTIQMQFDGHYDGKNLDEPPFAIYYPKAA